MKKQNNRKIRKIRVIYLAICFTMLFGINAQAYIDPSVVTYMIQAIAGIAIAIGAAFGIYFRRARRFIYRKFGIDENRNKEVEINNIVYDNSVFHF